ADVLVAVDDIGRAAGEITLADLGDDVLVEEIGDRVGVPVRGPFDRVAAQGVVLQGGRVGHGGGAGDTLLRGVGDDGGAAGLGVDAGDAPPVHREQLVGEGVDAVLQLDAGEDDVGHGGGGADEPSVADAGQPQPGAGAVAGIGEGVGERP